MKKKTVLAMMAMCMVLTTAACGNDSSKETDTKQEAAQKEEKTEKKVSSGTRLVTVDDVSKYIKIGEYKGIELENTVQEVTDEEVEYQIRTDLENNAKEVDDAAKEGDLITIDFVGTKDGVAFEGGTANDYDMTLGEAGMIDGFESGIVGMKKGETRNLDLTFPEDYFEESLAGQPVVFQITLQSVRRVSELTDEWAAKNMDVANAEEYRAKVRADLEANAQEMAKSTLRDTAWDKVMTASEIIEYPEKDIENAQAEFKKLYQDFSDQAGIEMEDFLESQGLTMEQFEEQGRQYAELKVKQNLLIQGIMDAEGLSLEDEECLALQDQLIQNYGAKDLADLIDQYGQVAVDESIGLLRAEEFVVQNAVIKEQVANGELVGENADEAAGEGEEPEAADPAAETEPEAADPAEEAGEEDSASEIDEELEEEAEEADVSVEVDDGEAEA